MALRPDDVVDTVGSEPTSPALASDPTAMTPVGVENGTVFTDAAQDTDPRRRGAFTSKFLRNRLAVAGLVFIVLLTITAIFAPLIAPKNPNTQVLSENLRPPSGDHLLGTDLYGRDMLSRIVFGARVSLIAGLEVVAIGAILGGLMGLLAGVSGKVVDSILTFVNNTILSVPGLVLAIAVVASLGPGLGTSMFAIGIVMAPRFFRVARSATKDLRQELFVTGARSIGCSRSRVVFAHILPNAMPPLLIQVTFVFGTAMLAEASLSYLGLGVQPPTPSWGSMLAAASTRLDQPHLLWVPGIALSLAILSFALVGDGLRDAIGVGRTGS